MHTPIANIADWRTQLPLIHARDFAPSQYDIPVLLPQPSPAHHISLHELRQIDYYRRVMIGRLDGACPSQLWTQVVLPASFSEPAIMHALVAFAGLHEEGERDVQKAHPSSERNSSPGNEASGRKPRTAFELGQINKAIRALVQHNDTSSNGRARMANTESNMEMVLIVCLLFLLQDIMAGDYDAALSHLQHGISMIEKWSSRKHFNREGGFQSKTCEALLAQFQRVDMVAANWGKGHRMKLLLSEEEMNADFVLGTLDHARTRLYMILNWFYEIERVKTGDDKGHPLQGCQNNNASTIDRQRMWIKHHLTTWYIAFGSFLASKQLPGLNRSFYSPHAMPDFATPGIEQFSPDMALVSTDSSLYLQVFAVAVACARALNELCAHSTPGGKVYIDMGTIAPLYFTAVQSSTHQRRALLILQGLVKQNCFWHDEAAFSWAAGQAVDVVD